MLPNQILKHQINLQPTGEDTYTIGWHHDWTLGMTLTGSCLSAALHHTAETHLSRHPKLKAVRQPDVLRMHIQFLRTCAHQGSAITVRILKLGAVTSTLQLELRQDDRLCALALVTSTDFDRTIGPTCRTDWKLAPAPSPLPDFKAVEAYRPEANWVPGTVAGELIPLTGRMLALNPRGGFPTEGVIDTWNMFKDGERIDSTYLALFADLVSSMSDSMLRNGGTYDAHAFVVKLEAWAEKNPGVPALLTNTLEEAMKSEIFNMTATLDIEFKRRLPEEGLKWAFIRGQTKVLEKGRMDLDVFICDEKYDLVAEAHQLILVLEAGRKFKDGKPKASL